MDDFRSGAPAKSIEKSRVCPLLFGLSYANVAGPLSTLQMCEFDKDEFLKLMKTINSANESPLDDSVLRNVFEKYWPDLATEVENELAEEPCPDCPAEFESEPRSEREMLEEVLDSVRWLRERLDDRYEQRKPPPASSGFWDAFFKAAAVTEATALAKRRKASAVSPTHTPRVASEPTLPHTTAPSEGTSEEGREIQEDASADDVDDCPLFR